MFIKLRAINKPKIGIRDGGRSGYEHFEEDDNYIYTNCAILSKNVYV